MAAALGLLQDRDTSGGVPLSRCQSEADGCLWSLAISMSKSSLARARHVEVQITG